MDLDKEQQKLKLKQQIVKCNEFEQINEKVVQEAKELRETIKQNMTKFDTEKKEKEAENAQKLSSL